MTMPPVISISQPQSSPFASTGPFESQGNLSFHHPHPLSFPITTKAGETCRTHSEYSIIIREQFIYNSRLY